MALFSNEDVLGWFNASNPIPAALPPSAKIVETGKGKSKAIKKLKAQAAEIEAAKEMKRKSTRPKPAPRARPTQESYYERVLQLERASKIYNSSQSGYETDILEDLEVDDIGPGRPLDPKAAPGDDNYEPPHAGLQGFYKPYQSGSNLTPKLPIANHRESIVCTIESNSVTVIQGETGCGKSTQVAQYILDHHSVADKYCNIVCTQPRRIAATSIAKYVCECRQWEMGQLVGYQIGMDRCVSENTRLSFVTTGVLLQKMINMRNLNQFTHIILDEVHERDADTDFCLLVVRKLLRANSKHVKVILMSATIEAQMFADYFSSRVDGILQPAPLVFVEGRMHEVLEFYLDDIRNIGTCKPMEPDNPRISEEAMKIAQNLIINFEEIETRDPAYRKGDFVKGTVLMFLPGMPEIREMEALLKNNPELVSGSWTILPLHSTISTEDQRMVFKKPEPGHRKIILATNIAESSITVPDIKYVIDFCLVKQLMCDWHTKYVCLKTVLASLASLTQRKGRAGRVSHGRCYRLITRAYLNKHIPEYSTPEMLRCPLEGVVLKAKKLDLGEPRYLLGSALQPPKLDDIERAILNLKEVGALTVMYKGLNNPYNGDLTYVGELLETLPIDIRLGKLIILGHVFGCLEACIIIAAALSTKPFLMSSFMDPIKAYKSKKSWAESSASDCIAFLNAYKEWCNFVYVMNHRDWRSQSHWCSRNMISLRAMKEVEDVVRELKMRLSNRSITPPARNVNKFFGEDPHDHLILKLVICGAFYPQYFRWGAIDEETSQKAMSGHDPRTTVVLSSLPRNAERYIDQICQLFRNCGKGKAVHFETFKAYVEFEKPHPSHMRPLKAVEPVLDSVYVALKRRHERNKLSIYIDNRHEGGLAGGAAWKFPNPPIRPGHPPVNAETKGLKEMVLPDIGHKQIIITEHIDAGHFWAQFADHSTTRELRMLHYSINEQQQKPLNYPPLKLEGVYCLAPFSQDKLYYRAKVVGVKVNTETRESYAEVVFVDYGNMEIVNTNQLCELSPNEMELEMQAFECFLTSVKPSIQCSSDGKWSYGANVRFRQLTEEKYLIIRVYSLVGSTLRVELYDTNSEEDLFVNEVLVNEGLAERCEEPYESKLSHAQAEQAHTSEATKGTASGSKTKYQSTVKTVEWTTEKQCDYNKIRRIELQGPDSMYEVVFHPMTVTGGYRQARIERDSVNCIVIDNESYDQHERLMVAGHVAMNSAGNTCIARHTTLMPNIHGLIHLVTILFAPCVEMRTDELKRQYTGAICGLGFDPETDESIYSEHDIELTFDTLISQDDLKMINNLRLAINLALDSEDTVGELNSPMLQKIQARARELIKELILKPRESVTPYQSVVQGWNVVDQADILRVVSDELEDSSPSLYPLHSGINISEERIDMQRSTKVLLLREKMKELHKKASDSTATEKLSCDLCNVLCGSPYELRSHLKTLKHLVCEENLFKDDIELDMTKEQLSKLQVV